MKLQLTAGICLSFFILCCLAFGSQPLMAGEVPPAVEQAASEGLPVLLQAVPEKILSQFYFSGPEEIDQASLGTPFQVFTIDPQEILHYQEGTAIEAIVSATDHWFFPVTVDGQVRTLLTVAKMGDTWQAVTIGASGLGRQWSDTVTRFSPAAGYTHKLVRIYQAKADFVLLGGAGGDELLPLKAGRIALGGGSGKVEPMDSANVIFELQGTVERNIKAFQ